MFSEEITQLQFKDHKGGCYGRKPQSHSNPIGGYKRSLTEKLKILKLQHYITQQNNAHLWFDSNDKGVFVFVIYLYCKLNCLKCMGPLPL